MTADTNEALDALVKRLREGADYAWDSAPMDEAADMLEEQAAKLAEAEANADRLAEALEIAGPIALADFANHPFILNDREKHQVVVISSALAAHQKRRAG